MVKRDFNEWLETFRESISDYKYYVDFETVYKNIEEFKPELEILSSLVGSQTIEEDFDVLIKNNPNLLRAIPILIAKRENEIFCMDENGSYLYDFKECNYPIEQYKYFMKQSGLFFLLQHKIINNLFDYVLGVEAGLNANGRKNRGGHLMEDLVEKYIEEAGFVKNKTYFKEMYLSNLEKIANIDLSSLSNKGKTEKRFDYVIISDKCIYACECNFYASGGSKLNETARSYKELAIESKNIERFKFVWFTDGYGWKYAKHNLEETFDVLEELYNINDLEDGILTKF